MDYQFIRTEIGDGIGTLTLNRPDKLNAVSLDVFREARSALAQFRDHPQVRSVILTGAGRAFCAGADFGSFNSALSDARSSPSQALRQRMDDGAIPFLLEIHNFPKPVVCAVNGMAVGGGAGLALIGDVVIAAREASFVLPQVVKLGLVPDLGITWLLARRIGRARADALMYLGESLPSETAERWGLIWKCVAAEELMAEARRIAQRLGSLSNVAFLRTRELAEISASNTLAQQLRAETDELTALSETEEFASAVQAFLQGKKAS